MLAEVAGRGLAGVIGAKEQFFLSADGNAGSWLNIW